jgi:hypothetical protein
MSDAYVATGAQNVTTTDITALVIDQGSSPTKRGRIYYLSAAFAGGTPIDHVQGIAVQRTTATGTATPVTPVPLDGAAAAALLEANENHTAEPTYTAATELLDLGVHLRSVFQYFAKSPWVIPSTANAGIGIFLQSDGSRTDLWNFAAEWEE